MRIYDSVTELVGATPLVRLHRVEQECGLQCALLAKLEGMNPAGSAKDRVAVKMIETFEKEGKLFPGATIVEPTSGNTGVGLAMAAAAKGYRVVLTMPDTMSVERQLLLRAYGAQVVLTDGARGMAGAIEKAREICAQTPGSLMAGQFDNPANPQAHYETTGPEIWRDTAGMVDIFVAGVGTGGTVTGAGRFLKEQKPTVRVIAAEPASSPVLSGGKAGPHGLQGMGAGFVPRVLDTGVYDDVMRVTEEEAYAMARLLAEKEGILCGISSGAALHAAVRAGRDNPGRVIVALLPDTGERYLSTALFAKKD